jgi:hypothetical protein
MSEFQSFNPACHISGWTYMKCPFCFKRINIQEEVAKLPTPEQYGDLILTHKALYRCRCGETRIVVEGTTKTMVLNGCFAREKSKGETYFDDKQPYPDEIPNEK